MGYEYHRRSHGTRVLSPWWKNPGYRDEEGKQEMRKKRGRGRRVVWRCRQSVYHGSSGKVSERRVKAAESAAAPPAAGVAVGAASTLSLPLAPLDRRRPCNPSRAEPPPRPGIEISLASARLEGVGRVYAAATVDRIVCAHAQPNARQLRHWFLSTPSHPPPPSPSRQT